MSYRLLLADDSVTIQRVIELTFADEDVQVIVVGDGDQAIARLDADPPDIVLADAVMPGRDGYEVAAHIKHSPRLAHIPVVLLVGAFEPADEVRAKAAGCDSVLAKPFEPQTVISRVRELLGRGGRPGSVPPLPQGPLRPRESEGAATAHAGDGPDRAALDEYFDRLDAAFAELSTRSLAHQEPAGSATSIDSSIDWFPETPPTSPAPDLRLSYASPQSEAEPPAEPPVTSGLVERPTSPETTTAVSQLAMAAKTPAAVSTPVPAPVTPPLLPPSADASAKLPAFEPPSPSSAAAGSAPMVAGTDIPDELVEQVTQRVLARLSDRALREAVSEIVSAVAERLVREEIERIKASIK